MMVGSFVFAHSLTLKRSNIMKAKGIPNVVKPTVGMEKTITYPVTEEALLAYLSVFGNGNIAHRSLGHASMVGKRRPAVPSSFFEGVVSFMVGNYLPGAGCRVLREERTIPGLAFPGDVLTVSAKVTAVDDDIVKIMVTIVDQHDEPVCFSDLDVRLPPVSMRSFPESLPKVRVRQIGAKFEELLVRAATLPSVVAVVAYPKDIEPIRGAMLAHDEGIATPIFVGDEEKIRTVASEHDVSLEGSRIVSVDGDERVACDIAVKLVRDYCDQGIPAILVKGSPKTATFVKAIIHKEDRAKGLTTKAGGMLTHGLVMDIPSYPELIAMGDVAIVPHPDVKQKEAIARRLTALLRAVGVREVRAAFLAGSEGVSTAMPETSDAKMLEELTAEYCLGEGPLSLDLATSSVRAERKGFSSKIKSAANLLVFPTLAGGNFLYKGLEIFGDAMSAGVVFGADVPVVLVSRGDDAEAFLYSIALAQMLLGSGEYAKLV